MTALLIGLVFLNLYFAPSTLAMYRHHPRTGTIVLLNLLGFTWPVALLMALKAKTTKETA
jgi:hypothetical protein